MGGLIPKKIMSSDVKILQPEGILDGTKSVQFRQDISALVENKENKENKENTENKKKPVVILIDFKNVTFMDSSGLGALVLALKTVRASGSQLFVCSINEQIRILFELTSMDRVFEIFESQEKFLAYYKEQNQKEAKLEK